MHQMSAYIRRIQHFTRSLSDSVSGLGNGGSFLLFWGVLVELHEFGKIELGFLEDLGLSDHAGVLQWEDLAALGLNLLSNLFFEAIE